MPNASASEPPILTSVPSSMYQFSERNQQILLRWLLFAMASGMQQTCRLHSGLGPPAQLGARLPGTRALIATSLRFNWDSHCVRTRVSPIFVISSGADHGDEERPMPRLASAELRARLLRNRERASRAGAVRGPYPDRCQGPRARSSNAKLHACSAR